MPPPASPLHLLLRLDQQPAAFRCCRTNRRVRGTFIRHAPRVGFICALLIASSIASPVRAFPTLTDSDALKTPPRAGVLAGLTHRHFTRTFELERPSLEETMPPIQSPVLATRGLFDDGLPISVGISLAVSLPTPPLPSPTDAPASSDAEGGDPPPPPTDTETESEWTSAYSTAPTPPSTIETIPYPPTSSASTEMSDSPTDTWNWTPSPSPTWSYTEPTPSDPPTSSEWWGSALPTISPSPTWSWTPPTSWNSDTAISESTYAPSPSWSSATASSYTYPHSHWSSNIPSSSHSTPTWSSYSISSFSSSSSSATSSYPTVINVPSDTPTCTWPMSIYSTTDWTSTSCFSTASPTASFPSKPTASLPLPSFSSHSSSSSGSPSGTLAPVDPGRTLSAPVRRATIIGSLLGALCLIGIFFFVVFFIRRRQHAQKHSSQPPPLPTRAISFDPRGRAGSFEVVERLVPSPSMSELPTAGHPSVYSGAGATRSTGAVAAVPTYMGSTSTLEDGTHHTASASDDSHGSDTPLIYVLPPVSSHSSHGARATFSLPVSRATTSATTVPAAARNKDKRKSLVDRLRGGAAQWRRGDPPDPYAQGYGGALIPRLPSVYDSAPRRPTSSPVFGRMIDKDGRPRLSMFQPAASGSSPAFPPTSWPGGVTPGLTLPPLPSPAGTINTIPPTEGLLDPRLTMLPGAMVSEASFADYIDYSRPISAFVARRSYTYASSTSGNVSHSGSDRVV